MSYTEVYSCTGLTYLPQKIISSLLSFVFEMGGSANFCRLFLIILCCLASRVFSPSVSFGCTTAPLMTLVLASSG